MIIVLKPNLSTKDQSAVLKEIKRLGYQPHVMRGVARTVIGAIGDERTHQSLDVLRAWPQVESVTPIQKRYKLVSREAHPQNSTVRARNVVIGARPFIVMAGPCSVESERQLLDTAHGVKAAGAQILRGGAFKPRTSPYEFQGLGEKGLKLLAKARKETGLPIITELLSEDHAELVAEYADILQIGARNSQNFQLLIAAAKTGKPVLLKRGLSMKIEEWLLAGEYVLSNNNAGLLFCERGIRTFETYTRNTLDLAAIPIIKQESHCPVVIDPSQGAGRADLVASLCKGAVAMGADALLIEVHPNPKAAMSDSAQQLSLEGFAQLMKDLKPFITAAGRD
ncbi:MAG TPA: 3-deoxy-7-phosphoheptulonate synthase [Verrucomicrobiota bacterium]|nr:3-deoxy-7-phosphoheptulonate synthase [Verrucomicrobiales bacterium]HRI11877.1 3-deoxy-7-phosphoheptulonate synthase [Verrucomicrobiota bacterium]